MQTEQKKLISAISRCRAIVSKPILSEMCPLNFPKCQFGFWFIHDVIRCIARPNADTIWNAYMQISVRWRIAQKRSHILPKCRCIRLIFPMAIDSEADSTMLSIRSISNCQFKWFWCEFDVNVTSIELFHWKYWVHITVRSMTPVVTISEANGRTCGTEKRRIWFD